MLNLPPKALVLLSLLVFAPYLLAQDSCTAAVNPDLCTLANSGKLTEMRWPNFVQLRDQVNGFYQPANFAPAWVVGNRPTFQALSLIQLFAQADLQGLRPEDYDGPRWEARLNSLSAASAPSSTDLAYFDLAITVSAMRYISDIHNGRISPKFFDFGIDVKHRQYDLAGFLRSRVVPAPNVTIALADVEPPYGGYLRTKAALDHYKALAQQGDGPVLPAIKNKKKSVDPGDTYDGVPQLAQRLQVLGDLSAADAAAITPQSNIYQGALVEAVKHFQDRHGLPNDGSIGAATLREINTPIMQRVHQLEYALERWRWLPRELGERFIVVNIPEFTLYAFENQKPALTMHVIVGQAFHEKGLEDHHTPVFQNDMQYVIFHPYWNIPPDIAKREIVPGAQKDANFMNKHQYELVNKQDVIEIPETFDAATIQQIANGDLSIRQRPGTSNSLGPIKFVFPNQYDVYFHGTPEQKLFSHSRRDFSHGCIRLENPAVLAQWVLKDDPSWTMDRIQESMKTPPESKLKNPREAELRVTLPKPIPVFILYGTADVAENGEVRFFDDIYGNDRRLAHALAAYPHVAALPATDKLKLPPPDRPNIHVNEVSTAIVPNPTTVQSQSSVP